MLIVGVGILRQINEVIKLWEEDVAAQVKVKAEAKRLL